MEHVEDVGELYEEELEDDDEEESQDGFRDWDDYHQWRNPSMRYKNYTGAN